MMNPSVVAAAAAATMPVASFLQRGPEQQQHTTTAAGQLSWSIATQQHQHEDHHLHTDSRSGRKSSESSSDDDGGDDDDDARGTTTIHSASPTAKNSIYSKDGREKYHATADNFYTKCSRALLLENTASVARDHLANERTFLAWLRTSLSLTTVGVAITQLYHLSPADTSGMDHRKLGRGMGVLFVLFSLLFLYFGNTRYFHAQHAMCKGFFPASRGSVLFASASVLCMLMAMFVVLSMQ